MLGTSRPHNYGTEDKHIKERLDRYTRKYRELVAEGMPGEEASKLAKAYALEKKKKKEKE